ncbi:MAG: signal peptidase I [Acidobacteria bacterium]|nr:MAG: signal peptidase I [Acidobacteriota bacterium]
MEETLATGGSSATVLIILIIQLAIIIFIIAAMWKVFTKAGKPGWAILIPFYNLYILLKVAGKPGWWLILLFIPIVNIVISIIAAIGIANNFGKGVGFAIGLLLLPFIFYPILAFGSAEYQVASVEITEST